ncbi:MAG: metal ABC transporter permease [Candidatus Limisoma sp.]
MEIFDFVFFRNALIGIILVSIASAMIGTYVIVRRLMFVTGGITHSCFGGLGLGYYLGWNPLLVAGAFAIGSAVGVEWLSTRQHVRSDTAISVVWSLGMALGVIFIFMTPGYVPELNSFLFGNLLTITTADLTVFAVYLAVLVGVFVGLYRMITVCAFDADYGRTIGLPVRAVNLLMLVLVAVSVVLTLKLIGIMLLMSLFGIPQMIAEVFTPRLRPMMIIAAAVSVVCSVAGLFISYYSDVPASATIVVTLVAAYVVARLVKKLFKCNKSRA